MTGKSTFQAIKLQAHHTATFDKRDVPKRCLCMGYGCFLIWHYGAPKAALVVAFVFLAIEVAAYTLRAFLPQSNEDFSDPLIALIIFRVFLAVNIFAAAGVVLILQPFMATAIAGLIFLSGVAIHAIIAHVFLPMVNWVMAPTLAWSMAVGTYLIVATDRTPLAPGDGLFIGIICVLWIGTMLAAIIRQTGTRRTFSDALAVAQNRAEQLAYLSRHDALTGLLNRAAFDEILLDALQFDPDQGPLAVVLLDLDKFKPVNDTYGHAAGDAALVEMARRISQILGQDCAARLGGDEFVGVITGARSRAHVEQIAQRLKNRLSEPVMHGDIPLQIGASIGVAIAEGPGEDRSSLIARADRAMYGAKSTGSAHPILAETRAKAG
ncbi:MAG: diguanylate cyclase [Silicimonas sp.]|nr:diguanylate cyclase [Silicimonas sp.]